MSPGPAQTLRAVGWLSLGLGLRVLREGLLVRAVLWPGLLCALVMCATAVGVTIWLDPAVYVEDERWVEPLEELGFEPQVVEAPWEALRSGEAPRAVWREGETWTLGVRQAGRQALQIEGLLRDEVGAAWRIEVPERAQRSAAHDRRRASTMKLMAAMLALLYTLYGAVFGAGSVARDAAVLEAERALPFPFWIHGLSRIVASGALLGATFGASIALFHGLLTVPDASAWAAHGAISAWSASALGVWMASRAGPGEGFSGPLTRGMALCAGLLALGWQLPAAGAHLPVASLGALLRGEPLSLGAPVLALVLTALAARASGRRP